MIVPLLTPAYQLGIITPNRNKAFTYLGQFIIGTISTRAQLASLLYLGEKGNINFYISIMSIFWSRTLKCEWFISAVCLVWVSMITLVGQQVEVQLSFNKETVRL